MTAVLLILWLALVGVLSSALFKAVRRGKKNEALLIGCILACLILLTGEYALFFAWTIGCSLGLPLSCRF